MRQLSKPKPMCVVQAAEFVERHIDDLFERNRVDGKDKHDLLTSMCLGPKTEFIGTYYKQELVAITCYEKYPTTTEVHTYVSPCYVLWSDIILKEHRDWILDVTESSNLTTMCSNFNQSVYNFLRKRLGFKTYSVDLGSNMTRDGKQMTIYNLIYTKE